MGHMSAMGMAEAGGVNEMTISWHLTSNHYPPLPNEMVPVALEAIDAMNEEDPDREIDLRNIVQWKEQTTAPAWALVDHMHLDAFLGVGAEVEL